MKTNASAIDDSRPLSPYQEGNYCFTQSADSKTQYAFFLVEQGEYLPKTLSLPAAYIQEESEIYLLSFDEPLAIKTLYEQKTISIPADYRKKYTKSPPLMLAKKFKPT